MKNLFSCILIVMAFFAFSCDSAAKKELADLKESLRKDSLEQVKIAKQKADSLKKIAEKKQADSIQQVIDDRIAADEKKIRDSIARIKKGGNDSEIIVPPITEQASIFELNFTAGNTLYTLALLLKKGERAGKMRVRYQKDEGMAIVEQDYFLEGFAKEVDGTEVVGVIFRGSFPVDVATGRPSSTYSPDHIVYCVKPAVAFFMLDDHQNLGKIYTFREITTNRQAYLRDNFNWRVRL